ncbi:hypothetical protein PWY87_31670 [Kribbella solani]|nr:hypothetical protein [Kribbella solani]MDX3006278.1 hypothetical protein [Kribbella solani]
MDWLLAAAGADRLLWGSDFSPALGHLTYEQTIALPPLRALPIADRTGIYGANLRRLLAVDQQG